VNGAVRYIAAYCGENDNVRYVPRARLTSYDAARQRSRCVSTPLKYEEESKP